MSAIPLKITTIYPFKFMNCMKKRIAETFHIAISTPQLLSCLYRYGDTTANHYVIWHMPKHSIAFTGTKRNILDQAKKKCQLVAGTLCLVFNLFSVEKKYYQEQFDALFPSFLFPV